MIYTEAVVLLDREIAALEAEVPHETVYYSYEQRQLAEARAERDLFAHEVVVMLADQEEGIGGLRVQRDALAAQLAEVRSRARAESERGQSPHPMDVRYFDGWRRSAEVIFEGLSTAPAVSLALHDAEVKAQALEEAADAEFRRDQRDERGKLRARAAAIREEAANTIKENSNA